MLALRSWLLVLGLPAVATCGSPSTPSAQPAAFTSVVSFGFCAPAIYCTSRLELSERRAVLTHESRERAPLVQRRDLQPGEWQRLVAALDAARLRALPGRIGCPDCADGGAETLTVAFAEGPSSSVTFEYNVDVPGIEAVQAQIRTIRQSFARPDTGPLSRNGGGNDRVVGQSGSMAMTWALRTRSAIFPQSPEQQRTAERVKARVGSSCVSSARGN